MVEYTPKTSVKNLSTLLQKVTVLVVDPDLPIANIVKHVLSSLGFGTILIEHDGDSAVEVFKSQSVDFIITDFDISTGEGDEAQSFVEFIRKSPESPNPAVPVIMLTGHTEQHDIESARDLGVSEIASKPFTAKSLCDRIVRIVENPRSFIITKRYTGPDRRRKLKSPPVAGDRRKSDVEKAQDSKKKISVGKKLFDRWKGNKA